jgi:periplasmic protein TonB
MTNKIDSNDDNFDLPPDLAELDRELSNISIEVRSSFGPELLAELEQARKEAPPGRIQSTRRNLIAAGLGALLLAGLSEPARASLARLIPWVGGDPVETLVTAVTPEIEETDQPVLLPEELDGTPDFDLSVDDVVQAPVSLAPRALVTVDRNDQNRMPTLEDRAAAREDILRRYPRDLMLAGIGGTVDLRFWVTLDGSVDNVQMTRSSGQRGLDVAAMGVAQGFRFNAARRNGVPVGSWVDFPVVFEAADGPSLAEPPPIGDVPVPDDLMLPLPSDLVLGSYLTPPPTLFEAQQLLGASLGASAQSGGRWSGQLEALLMAEPPADELPNTWRREATVELESAMAQHPANPAPALALARIRKSQGMNSEARRLFQEGIDRAALDETISASLVAELHYEMGMMIQEEWQAYANLGRLARVSLDDALCPAAPTSVKDGRWADVGDLLSLNMVCPVELGRVLAVEFEGLPAEVGSSRNDMLRAFQLARENQPTHGPANVEVLLDLADQRRWETLLERSQAFVWETQGNPHGLLLTGLALERLGRVEQAAQRFEVAMKALEEDEVEALRDISMLMVDDRARVFGSLRGPEKEEVTKEFFRRLDPILTTDVNERAVEHLARASYALLRFGSTKVDPARVWIRYGRPNTVHTFGEGLETRTEFWDYGVGPDLTFRREASARRMDLTEGSSNYVDDLLVQFPHLYNGAALRRSLALEGQVSRFRVTRGMVELEITTEVPAELATGVDDELDLSIFLLDARGDKVSATRRKVPAIQQTLRLRPMANPDAKQVVVELFSPTASLAASLRERVPLGDPQANPVISDLLFLEPADPGENEVRRTAAWVTPNIGLVPESGEVGVLFEMYEMPVDEDFALRVVLTTEDGTSHPVEFRPAGESEYRSTWRQSANGSYRTTEYITANLEPFSTGSYTLTVRALRSGGAGEVSSSRAVRIR